jgi:predicted ribosome-associated RNA-binding protein Tma20
VQGVLVQEELMAQGVLAVQEELMVQGVLVVQKMEHEKFAMEVLEALKPVNEMVQCAQVLMREQVPEVLLKEHLPPFLLEEA